LIAVDVLDGSHGAGVGPFLRPHPIALALCLALVGWTASRIAALHAAWRDRLLAFGVWCAALLVLYSQALSALTQLHWPGLLMLSGLGAAIAILVRGPRRDGPSIPWASGVSRSEAWLLGMLAVPIAAYGAGQAWLILSSFETCGDNVAYHLPRLGYWLQRQSVASFVSNDPRIGTFPPDGNIFQLVPVLFLRTERLSAFAQLLAFFGTGWAIVVISRELRCSRPAALAAASCWFSIPTALGQANVSWVDVVASSFTAAVAAFAIASVRRPGVATWTCLAAAGLAMGTKTQAVVIAVPATAVALSAAWRAGRRPSWRALAAGLMLVGALAAVGPAQNLWRFGSPLGYASVAWVVSNPGLTTFAQNLQLVLAPLNPFLDRFTPEGSLQGWSLVGALSAQGLGLIWLVAMMGALGHYAWRCARGARGGRLEAIYVAGALAFFASTLFAMRHQPSVIRFLLPAAALLTPLIGPAIEPWLARPGWRSVAPALLLAAAGGWVMLVWSVADLKGRVQSISPLVFKSYQDMCDSPLRGVANAFDGLGADREVPRVGVFSQQYFQQRFFFGPRYSNVVVPLSSAPELDLALLDRLCLDAVWLDASFPAVQLFRQPFSRPPVRSAESWRMASLSSYRESFVRALSEAVEYRSFEDLALRLARRGSGWGVAFADAHGLLFTRQATAQDALALLDVSSPNGVDVREGATYAWLGQEPVVVTVFAGRSGRIGLEGAFLPRAERKAWPGRRVIVRESAQGRESPPAGETSLTLPVAPGLNRFLVQPRTADGEPGSRRPLALGPLRLAWGQ
jgi:hypothetical protein